MSEERFENEFSNSLHNNSMPVLCHVKELFMRAKHLFQ